MIILCRSVKGGSGTTVTAAALGLLLSARHRGGGNIIDLCGDLPATLGISEPVRGETCEVNSALRLMSRPMTSSSPESAWQSLCAEMSSLRGPVVVDAGSLHIHKSLVEAVHRTYLVTRPCYLALRRASHAIHHKDFPIDGCILVNEPGRALTASDVESVLRKPICAVLPVETSISRAVDAGLLSHRVPKVLDENLSGLIADASSQLV